MNQLILVATGGAAGALARYFLGQLISTRWPMWFPLGTFVINVTGSFIVGLILELAARQVTIHPHWRLLLVTGFAGAYTTFSTFEQETLALLEKGKGLLALCYVAASVMIGFAAVWAGTFVARLVSS